MIIYNLHKGNFSLLSGLQIPPNYQREIFPSDRFPPKLRPSPVRAFRFCGHKNTTCYSLFIVEATPVRIGGRCASFSVAVAASFSLPLLLPHLEERKPPEGFFRGRCCLRWRGEPQHLKKDQGFRLHLLSFPKLSLEDLL